MCSQNVLWSTLAKRGSAKGIHVNLKQALKTLLKYYRLHYPLSSVLRLPFYVFLLLSCSIFTGSLLVPVLLFQSTLLPGLCWVEFHVAHLVHVEMERSLMSRVDTLLHIESIPHPQGVGFLGTLRSRFCTNQRSNQQVVAGVVLINQSNNVTSSVMKGGGSSGPPSPSMIRSVFLLLGFFLENF